MMNNPSSPPAERAGPERHRLRRSARRLMVAAIVLGLLAFAALAVAFRSSADLAGRLASEKFLAIRPGMHRLEVRRLARDAGSVVMYTGLGTSEVMHVDGKFMIAVVYEPDPDGPPSGANPAGPIRQHWVAKEKMLLELGRGGRFDDLMVGLGLRPQRVVQRERMRR